MEKCKYCDKEFNTKIGLGVHIKKHIEFKVEKDKEKSNFNFCCVCGKKFKSKNSLHGHKAFCEVLNDLKNEERKKLLKDLLYDLFEIKNYTASYIHRFLNLKYTSVGTLICIAKNLNIKTKTIKESANNEKTRNKFKETCLNKYGDTNVLGKKSPIYYERNKTVEEKYGVKNVFQLANVKEKSKETLIKNFGVTHPIYIQTRYKNCGRKSKNHKKIENLLKELNISYESEKIKKFSKNSYNPRPDIIIENMNLVIEIYGDYWHANPNFYKDSDLIKRWYGNITAKEIHENDKKRIEQIESFGYKVIIIWETDIKNLNSQKLWNMLKLNQ